jgi:DnaJ-class molecular chaperone
MYADGPADRFEQEHPRFKREADNLVYTANITLKEALTGTTVEVLTLDNRTLRVSVTELVSPGYVKLVRGEGMPLQKSPDQKGDLYIKFNVVFPRTLTDSQKAQLRSVLP